MRAACSSFAQDSATPENDRIGPKALLDVHHDQGRAVADEQAHRAPAIEKARSR